MRTAATIWLCVLAAPGVQAAGFGPPEGTLPIHPLPVAVPAGALSPLRSSALFREESNAGAAPTYYLGAGVAGSRLQIPDSPGATAWQVVPTAACARLEPVPPGAAANTPRAGRRGAAEPPAHGMRCSL